MQKQQGVAVWILLLGLAAAVSADSISDCIRKDSISCLQLQLFRSARDLLAKPVLDIPGGITLTKEQREGKSLGDEDELEKKVEAAGDVEARQSALQDYLVNGAKSMLAERSISWDLGKTARAVSSSIPEEVKTKLYNFIAEEARGKKKKLKALLPLLLGLKVKFAILGLLAFAGIALIAKKALITSVLALLLSGFLAIKKLLSGKKDMSHVELSGYHGGGGGGGGSGWASGGSGWNGGGGWSSGGGGYAEHGSYSSPVGAQVAYSGHKTS